jgi:hypothetical protein
MPGNPKVCRRNAARCAELAMAARALQLGVMFLELSKNWEKLAIQLEDAFGKLTAITSNVRESRNETSTTASQNGSPYLFDEPGAARTSREAPGERNDEPPPHGCDRVWDVTLRPYWRRLWVDNWRERQVP